MSDEVDTIVDENPLEGNQVETEEVVAENDDQVETTEIEGNDGTEDDPSEPEVATVEIDGVQYQVPKALEGAFLMNKDYTQKTQKLSDDRKALEARGVEIEERLKATDEELEIRGQLHQIRSEIKRFENWDWSAYQQARQSDPMGADEAWAYKQHLENQKTQLEGKIQQSQAKRTEESQRDTAKRFQEAQEFAQKNIKGWSDETDRKLMQYVQNKGISGDFIRQNMSPILLDVLHKAMIGEQLLTKKPAAPKPAPTEPIKTVTAKTNPPPSGLSDKLSADEWVKRRNAQLAKKRA